MNNKFAAKEILEDVVPTSSNNKFLYAKVLVDLKDDRALTEVWINLSIWIYFFSLALGGPPHAN